MSLTPLDNFNTAFSEGDDGTFPIGAATHFSGASGAFDFDDKGFKFTARAVTPETAAKLKGIPLLGVFAESGTTHYVKFDDVKKLVTTLFKEMAVAKGILKGEEKK